MQTMLFLKRSLYFISITFENLCFFFVFIKKLFLTKLRDNLKLRNLAGMTIFAGE